MGYFENQIAYYEGRKTSNNNKIKKLEELYDSISAFKSEVETSAGEFNAIDILKDDVLTDIETIENCQSATRYVAGMRQQKDGIANAYVKAFFIALEGAIDLKKAQYWVEIEALEADNGFCNLKIAEYQALIEAEKELEKVVP